MREWLHDWLNWFFSPWTCKQFSASIMGRLTEYRVMRYSTNGCLAFSQVVTVSKFTDEKKSVNNRLQCVEIFQRDSKSVVVFIMYFALLTGKREERHLLHLWSMASHGLSQELIVRERNQIEVIIQCLISHIQSGHSGAVLCDVMSGNNIPRAFYLVYHDTWGITEYIEVGIFLSRTCWFTLQAF